MAAPTKKEVLDDVQKSWQDKSIAEKYARSEKATKPFGELMVNKAGFDKLEGDAHIFDLACGTGAVEAALYEVLPKEKWGSTKVLGGDISESMLDYLKERADNEGWTGVETQVIDATNIQLPKDTYTHLFINFAIFSLPLTTIPTCASLLRPGGFIGVSTWAYYPWYDLAARAVSNLPAATRPTMPPYADIRNKLQNGNPWNEPHFMAKSLTDAGFVDVAVETKKVQVDSGTPEQFVDVMSMPMKLVSMWWEEGRREELKRDVLVELRRVAEKDAGGEGRTVFLEFEGIVGTGRRPA